MSRKRQRKWVVHRKFEPSRLSEVLLEQAYVKVVPPHVRVLSASAGQWEGSRTAGQLAKGRVAK